MLIEFKGFDSHGDIKLKYQNFEFTVTSVQNKLICIEANSEQDIKTWITFMLNFIQEMSNIDDICLKLNNHRVWIDKETKLQDALEEYNSR